MIAQPHLPTPLPRTRGRFAWVGKKVVPVVAGIAVLAAAGVFWVYRAPVVDAVQEFVAKATGAEVTRVVVEGATYTPRDELLAAIGVQKGEPLVGFNTQAARERLEALPWVRLAAVEKKLPDGLQVMVYEHVPLARVLNDEGEVWVVNKDGMPVVQDTEEHFGALPLLDGEGAAEAAAKLFGVLAEWPNLATQLKDASHVGKRRWDLRFTSGVTVMLPEDNVRAALVTLAELERARHVLTLNGGEVDLRLPDRVVLRLPPEVEQTPVTNQPEKQG
ncbi:MAG: FtsQ-type POTRA domain-containing protein [Pseudomonadaceae bacterium]|nr:FtsQ-type POTRA domain-containing protein [Pseudomonadaceae bacterium]